MVWNTSQLLTMVHLNKKNTGLESWEQLLSLSALIRRHVLPRNHERLKELSPITATKESVLLVLGVNLKRIMFHWNILKLSASGCVQNVLSWGVNSKFAAWKRKPVMNIDESWEFGATVYSIFKSMVFCLSFFTLRTTAVSTERCYCGVGPKGNGVLPSRGSSGDPNAILIRWVRWGRESSGFHNRPSTIDRNTQLRIPSGNDHV